MKATAEPVLNRGTAGYTTSGSISGQSDWVSAAVWSSAVYKGLTANIHVKITRRALPPRIHPPSDLVIGPHAHQHKRPH
jgi:hypothetical protein